MYTCDICNYETENRTSLYHHKKSKKHLMACSKIDIAKFESIQKENTLLKQKLKDEESQRKILEKENEKLEAINKIYAETANKNKIINIGTFNYINTNFKEAPPLQKITNFVINGIDTNDETQHNKFIEDIIHYYNLEELHCFLGDHLVKLYKKKNINEQSFHTTDVSRLNYVVRILDNTIELYETSEEETNESHKDDEIMELHKEYKNKLKKLLDNKKANDIWTTDKNGYKICKLLIDPMIRHVMRILKKSSKDYFNDLNKKKTINKTDLERSKILVNILDSVDRVKLKKDINKYIAPQFNLDNYKLLKNS